MQLVRRVFSSCFKLSLLIWATASVAQPHPLLEEKGLKRFDINRVLNVPGQPSQLAIRDVFIGDNIVKQAITLSDKGGVLEHIRGGTRSDKLSFNFLQPYEHSQLKQKLSIYFDKYNGFIREVTVTYTIQDAYLSIEPVREKALLATIKKYGEPLTMQQVHQLSSRQQGEIKLSQFIDALQNKPDIQPKALAYFKQKNISRSAKLTADKQNYALMQSGFDRCYLFQNNNFDQLLTFCFFDRSSANPNSRGVELNLQHFSVAHQIEELGEGNGIPQISL